MSKDFISDEEMLSLEKGGQAKASDFISDEEMNGRTNTSSFTIPKKDLQQSLSKGGFFSDILNVGSDVIGGAFNTLKDIGSSAVNRTKTAWQREKFGGDGIFPGLGIAGQAAGFVGDVVGAGMSTVGRAVSYLTPDKIEDKVVSAFKEKGQDIMSTSGGRMALKAIAGGVEKWNEFKIKYPGVSNTIEDVANVAGLLTGLKVAEKPAEAISKNLTKKAIGQIDEVIDTAYRTGIKPSVNSKATKESVKSVVLDVVANKQNLSWVDDAGEVVAGKLPSTIREFENAARQRMSQIWSENKKKLSTVSGSDFVSTPNGLMQPKVDTTPLIGVLSDFISNPTISSVEKYKPAINYAKQQIIKFRRQGSYTVDQAQEIITTLNKSFGDEGVKSVVDLLLANNLRNSMDDAVEAVLGKSGKTLRDQYASYRKMIDDVAKRAAVEGRKNPYGLIDYAKVFTVDDLVKGLGGNVGSLASGVAQRGYFEWMKFKNKPDNIIKGMFKKVDDVVSKAHKYGLDATKSAK